MAASKAMGKKEKADWVNSAFGKLKNPEKIEPEADERKSEFLPLSFYWLKDVIREFVSYKNFFDALAVVFAFICIISAFPFYPLAFAVPLSIVLFALVMINPYVGLMALLLFFYPAIIYQAPLLSWVFLAFIIASLFLTFPHYRTIIFVLILITLPLSHLGLIFEMPLFVMMVLTVGCKRAAVATLISLLSIASLAGLTGIQPSGPIAYNVTVAHAPVVKSTFGQYLVISDSSLTLQNFGTSWSRAFSAFWGMSVTPHISAGYVLSGLAIANSFPIIVIQIFTWLAAVFAISNFAVKSRSTYKGAESSAFSVIVPITYYLLSYLIGASPNAISLASFVMAPILLIILEGTGVEMVKVLDVMKQDVLGKFGELMEDLTSGTKETFADIADYESIKKELTEAVLAPIEHRELTSAYGVKPAKGILLFGPPGTGKTLIMRALANEIRSGFYYIRASSIMRPYPGEGSQALSKIFVTARKNAPAVLFIDEIDCIGRKRAVEGGEATELLSTLLSEMDGFQKTSRVVMVGATNVPQVLDTALTRPGRFDKAIYVPLPDQIGREEILRYYFSKLPIGDNIDFAKLAGLTPRFSGADLKNLADEVARSTAEDALAAKKILRIGMNDILRVLRATKPSTPLSQIEEYNNFKLDFERRLHPEKIVEEKKSIKLSDVVGLEDAKKAMYEAIEVPILHPDLVKKYDIESARGILLFGPPGTGKTLLMHAIANELGEVHIMTISGYDISKHGLENAVTTIKSIFDRAKENVPSIVFVDEVDALVPARDNTTDFGSQLAGEFLEEFDKLRDVTGVVVVAATNRPDVLDPALLRAGRFDKLIFIPPPGQSEREEIFKHNLEKAPISKDIDFANLASISRDYTGADIANICRQAKLNSLEENIAGRGEVQITMQDLLNLVKSTRPSSPSIVLGRYLNFLSRYGER